MKHSKLSIATIVLGFLFFPAAIITGLIDIIKGSKEEKHVLTYVGLGIAALMLIVGVTNYKPSSQYTAEVVETASSEVSTTQEAPAEAEAPEYSLPEDATVSYQNYIDKDVTGRWRLARVASVEPIEEYAPAYYHLYFESDDEIHYVVNFTLNTTSCVKKVGDSLDITTFEYVEKEEFSAKNIGGGQMLGHFFVNIETGEIEKLK